MTLMERKQTGIVRRVDDLGRVVIPRSVRQLLGIEKGDLLEIYIDDEGFVSFKKYEGGTEND